MQREDRRLAYAAVIALFSLAASLTLFPARQSAQHQATTANAGEEPGQEYPWWRSYGFWEAFFTGCIALIAIYQIRESRVSNERQLRAYLQFAEGHIRIPTTHDGEKVMDATWRIEIAFKNFGKTPAFDVFVRYKALALSTAENEGTELPLPEKVIEGRYPVVSPGDPLVLELSRALPRGRVNFRAINMQKKSIYVWGILEYADTFGDSHWTRFQIANSCGDVHSFHACPKGNSTDDKIFRTAV